ncbi:MAG: MBL fold metallo-hydrolase [Candidatus Sericytochromatia bacterium]
MSDNQFFMKVWGARGSIPTPGPKTIKYGGNTSCLEVRCGNEILIFDAGTGIRELGVTLREQSPFKAHIFFSHLHWDHIQGFPFFSPFYTNNEFHLYGERKTDAHLEDILSQQMKYPFFPVPIPKSPSKINFNDVKENQEISIGDIKVTAYRANHPDGCLAYRVDYGGKSLVYATDTEHTGSVDKNLIKASENADIFIYDCNYTEEEYEMRKGWGHSTWNEALKIMKESGAKKLILWHHDPMHNDSFITDLENKVKEHFSNTKAAEEGMIIKLI